MKTLPSIDILSGKNLLHHDSLDPGSDWMHVIWTIINELMQIDNKECRQLFVDYRLKMNILQLLLLFLIIVDLHFLIGNTICVLFTR